MLVTLPGVHKKKTVRQFSNCLLEACPCPFMPLPSWKHAPAPACPSPVYRLLGLQYYCSQLFGEPITLLHTFTIATALPWVLGNTPGSVVRCPFHCLIGMSRLLAAFSRTAHSNAFTINTALPWVRRNKAAKCEID